MNSNISNQEVNTMNNQEVCVNPQDAKKALCMKSYITITAPVANKVTFWFEQEAICEAFTEFFEEALDTLTVTSGKWYHSDPAIKEVYHANEHFMLLDNDIGYVYERGFDIAFEDLMHMSIMLNAILGGTEYIAYAGTYERYCFNKSAHELAYSAAPSDTCSIEVSNTALGLSAKFTLAGDEAITEVHGDYADFIEMHSEKLIRTLREAFDSANSGISVEYADLTPYGMRIDFCREAPITILAGDTEDIYQVYVTNNTDTDKVVTALSAICTGTQFTVFAGSIEDYLKAVSSQPAPEPIEVTTEPTVTKVLTLDDFMKACETHGGNWTAMMLSGIRNLAPDIFEALPDVTYSFEEVCFIVNHLCVDRPHLRAIHSLGSKNGILYRTNEGTFAFRPMTDEEADMGTVALFEHLNGKVAE